MKHTIFSLGIAMLLILAACSSNKSEISGDTHADSAAETIGFENGPAPASRLVRTAELDLKVRDVSRSIQRMTEITASLGGLVTHQDIQSVPIASKRVPLTRDSVQVISTYGIDGRMTVRVPAEELNRFVQSAGSELIAINSSRLDIDDRSIAYLGNQLKQQSRKVILDRGLKNDTLQTAGLLQLADEQDKLIDSKLNTMSTDADVRFSTVSLHFSQNAVLVKETVPNTDLGVYEAAPVKRIAEALSSGLKMLLTLLIGFLYIWPILAAGAGVWLVFRFTKKRMPA